MSVSWNSYNSQNKHPLANQQYNPMHIEHHFKADGATTYSLWSKQFLRGLCFSATSVSAGSPKCCLTQLDGMWTTKWSTAALQVDFCRKCEEISVDFQEVWKIQQSEYCQSLLNRYFLRKHVSFLVSHSLVAGLMYSSLKCCKRQTPPKPVYFPSWDFEE